MVMLVLLSRWHEFGLARDPSLTYRNVLVASKQRPVANARDQDGWGGRLDPAPEYIQSVASTAEFASVTSTSHVTVR